MPSRVLRAAVARLALALVAVVVAGCGLVGGGSPADTVRQAVALVDAKDFDALSALACEAERDRIADQFNLAGSLGSLAGIDVEAILEAVELDTSKVVVTEASVDGDAAVVRMSGTIGVTFDAERLKAVIREMAGQQGLPIDENQLNLIVTQASVLAQNVPIDQSLNVVREDGGWRICGLAGS